MGACSIVVSGRGRNMEEAFRHLSEEAAYEYGSDPYNGCINNCELTGDVTTQRSNFKTKSEFIDHLIDKTNKREVKGFCTEKPIANTNQIKTVVTNYPQKGARKFETRYIAINTFADMTGRGSQPGIIEKTQTEAIKKAREYVAKHKHVELKVVVEKILFEGEEICAKIKYKKSSNERDGRYTFVGWAPE